MTLGSQKRHLSSRVAGGALLIALMATAFIHPRLVAAQEVSAPVAALQNLSDAFAELSSAASPAVVYVEVEKRRGNMDMRFHGQGGPGGPGDKARKISSAISGPAASWPPAKARAAECR